MQRIKATKKITELEVIASDSERLTSSLADVSAKFNTKKHFCVFDILKSKGLAISSLLSILLILPFLGVASVYSLFKHGAKGRDFEGKKDAYYDAKNNEYIDWRKLLLLHAKRFRYLISHNVHLQKAGITAVIFDDTLLEKTGKKIEKVSYVHDHTGLGFVLGYKLLVCGFWDGGSFIALDFSLHREKGSKHLQLIAECKKKDATLQKIQALVSKDEGILAKKELRLSAVNQQYEGKTSKTALRSLTRARESYQKAETKLKESRKLLLTAQKEQAEANKKLSQFYKKGKLYGLTAKEREAQHKKDVSESSAGYKRRQEADKSKIDCMLEMLARVVKHGFIPDYVLVDSWFFCFALLQKLNSLKSGAIKLVSMVKINNQVFTLCKGDKTLGIKNILKLHQREVKHSRKLKARYIKIPCFYKGIRVNLFFVAMGKSGTWHLLVTTDLDLNFVKLMEVYQIRWSIEVFFKECKQYLNLGNCKSSNFDAQIADTTITMLQHTMLSYCKRLNYQSSLGDLFKELSTELIELSLLEKLLEIFWVLVEFLCDTAGIDFIIFQQDTMRDEKLLSKFAKLIPHKVLDKAA